MASVGKSIGAVLLYNGHMEDGQKPMAKSRQPSKLDDHPLIPLTDFESKMREVLTVTPEEV